MKTCFLILSLFFYSVVFSQEGSKVYSLKPALGFNACQIDGDTYGGYDKLGVLVGTAVNAKLNQKWSLELGFYFSQKGSKHNADINNGDYHSLKINLNYVDMPFSVLFRFYKKFFVTAGTSVAYLIGFKEYQDGTNYTSVYDFNKFEWGANAGIGYNITNELSLELRNLNSIMPIRTYRGNTTNFYYQYPATRFFQKGMFNNVLSLFLSYKLGPLKKHREPQS